MTRPSDGPARPISIWQPRLEGGERVFVRPPPGPLGDHYAVRRVLPAAKPPAVRRICLFGESAAAGYLYAPHFTPAEALAEHLAAAAGAGRFEVVDLARTNETLPGLVETISAARQLAPDALVVWAGNNWNLLETPAASPYYPSVAGRRAFAAAWRRGGPMAAIERAARQRLEVAGRALAEIAAIAADPPVPVALVVPEVNLADWETLQPPVWLPGDATARWHALLGEALAALAEADSAADSAAGWEAVSAAARRMLDLDGGTGPTAYRLLARAHAGLGRPQSARAAAEAEVASCHYATLCFLAAPQAAPMDQELLRRTGRRHGFTVVDLPAALAAHTGSPLPGRRLFLDYCHLTAEGIRVAAAAVGEALLGRLAGSAAAEGGPAAAVSAGPPAAGGATGGELANPDPAARRAPRLADLATALPAAVEATARLGAAVHTAHRLLPVDPDPGRDPVAHWLREALAADPGIEAAMLDLVDARCAPAPEALSAAQQRNLASPWRLQHQHGWRYDHLDLALIATLREVLTAAGRTAAVAEIDARLAADHAVDRAVDRPAGRWLGREGLELVSPPLYLWRPLARFYPEVMTFADRTERAMLRCPWPSTDLGFVVAERCDLELTVTARSPLLGPPPGVEPAAPGSGTGSGAGSATAATPAPRAPTEPAAGAPPAQASLGLRLDGRPLAALPLAATWRTAAVAVPAAALAAGPIHRLTFAWPPPPAAGEAWIEAALGRLEHGLAADLHPVFGELWSVRVAAAGKPKWTVSSSKL